MPRSGGCHQTLDDSYFARDARGTLRRTCRSCLVSFHNNLHICLYTLRIQNSDNIDFRRNKTRDEEIEEIKVK